MTTVFKEFHISVLGSAEVGKSNLISRLTGAAFNRKASYKPSTQEEPSKTSIEVTTSLGLLLFHFYDWSWVDRRREVDTNVFNHHIASGRDGALFMYSVTHKETKKDFEFFLDWYQRAAGFEKPWIIVSNKNDSKKKTVSDEEGKSLANKGNQRVYVPISLVDDTGIDELIINMCRLLTNDANMTILNSSNNFGMRIASEDSMAWSAQRRETTLASAHMQAASENMDKTIRVLCLIQNSSVFEKIEQALQASPYFVEQVYSIDAAEEILLPLQVKALQVSEAEKSADAAPETKQNMVVSFLLGTPTLTEGQQAALASLATKYGIKSVVAVPRSMVGELQKLSAKA